jgi:TolB-like protein
MLAAAGGSASASGTSDKTSISLDEALNNTIKIISSELQFYKKTAVEKIAVIGFNSTENMSNYVIDELLEKLVNTKNFDVVDRQNLDLIKKEMDYQSSGLVNDESAVSIGRHLGAAYVITGSYEDLGAYGRFRIRVLNIETTKIETMYAADVKENALVKKLLGFQIINDINTLKKQTLKENKSLNTLEDLRFGFAAGGGGFSMADNGTSYDQNSTGFFSLGASVGLSFFEAEANINFINYTLYLAEPNNGSSYIDGIKQPELSASEIGLGVGLGKIWNYATLFFMAGGNIFSGEDTFTIVPYIGAKAEITTALKKDNDDNWGNIGFKNVSIGGRIRYDMEFPIANTAENKYFSVMTHTPLFGILNVHHKITGAMVFYWK